MLNCCENVKQELKKQQCGSQKSRVILQKRTEGIWALENGEEICATSAFILLLLFLEWGQESQRLWHYKKGKCWERDSEFLFLLFWRSMSLRCDWKTGFGLLLGGWDVIFSLRHFNYRSSVHNPNLIFWFFTKKVGMTPFLYLAFISLALLYNVAFEILSIWIKFIFSMSY